MVISAHSVGNHRREQAFNCRKQRNREGRRKQRQDVCRLKVGHGEVRKSLRDATELTADRLDWQVEASNYDR
jgi:hypothetical protein